MIRTVHTCDKCKEHVQPNQLHELTFQQRQYSHKYSERKIVNTDWCTGCMNEFGLHPHKPQKEIPKEVRPTIEDLIREIALEGVQQ